ncbi:hypothetical protein BDM02DRAFT_2362550 [Thelephora ganbajun]|uniref:Uncharacterized protein n=1 Tax=Thelephora ganbajun TaxID=370292 RepID=A0ACB6YYA3_THEGA|nr:hypothetical protein BDM02DRAFT_2362550 [Thelephora ganbajun]
MSNRPTLPPLRTLGLPNPCSSLREQMSALGVNDTNGTYDSLSPYTTCPYHLRLLMTHDRPSLPRPSLPGRSCPPPNTMYPVSP